MLATLIPGEKPLGSYVCVHIGIILTESYPICDADKQ